MRALSETLIKKLSAHCQWVGIRELAEKTTYLSVKKGRPAPLKTTVDHGAMVEVLVDGQFGYGATSSLDQEGLERAGNWALQLAQAAKGHRIFPFDTQVRPQALGNYLGPGQHYLDALSYQEATEQLIRVAKALDGDQILHHEVELMLVERTTRFLSSNGSDFTQKYFLAGPNIVVSAGSGSDVQTRTSGLFGNILQQGLEEIDFTKLQQKAELLRQEAQELLRAPDCPSGVMDLVLHPDQLYIQVHESIGHPLELDRILGDERNYAGHSFVKAHDFGTLQYGSPLLNVVFDPTVTHESATYLFDETGLQAKREYLIKDGILLRALGGAEAQVRSGVPGTANARVSSWNRPPIDRMANVNIVPGTKSFEQIIGSIERGIYMQTNRSWSIDDYRNKFQFGCEYGRLIENGKLTKVVKNPNYRGTSVAFWKSLHHVGDNSTYELWGSPFCGKGEPNQLVRVGHGTPVCAFQNVEVFGGGKA